MKTNKLQRKCVVCNQHFEKKELIRIVRDKEGKVFVDESGKANGRGAYICSSKKCLETAVKRKSFNHSLKTNVPENIYQEIEEYVNKR